MGIWKKKWGIRVKYKEIFQAENAQEVVQKLKLNPQNTVILAGGTDIMVKARTRDWYGNFDVIDISGVTEWKNICVENGKIHIGPLVTITQLLNSEIVCRNAEVLWKACGTFGVPQIRNRATIGGNLANACLAADTIPALCVLKAQLQIDGVNGEYTIEASELLKSAPACLNHEEMAVSTCFYGIPAGKKTILSPGEVITDIRIPIQTETYVTYFEKVGRKRVGCMSKFTVAAALWIDQGIVKDLRLSIGAAFSDIRLLSESCEEVIGKPYEAEQMKRLSEQLGERIVAQQKKPNDELRYKAEVCKRLLPVVLSEMKQESERRFS